MRVKAIKKGEYGGAIMEPGQVFDLVPKHGFKQTPKKNSKGEIISHKNEKIFLKPEDQFSENWMVQVGKAAKKTISLEKLDGQIVVKEKKANLPRQKRYHNGKAYGDHLPGEGPDDVSEEEDNLEDNDDLGEGSEDDPPQDGLEAQGSADELDVLS